MIEFFENDLKTLYPELFCIASSVALVMFGAAYGAVVAPTAMDGRAGQRAWPRVTASWPKPHGILAVGNVGSRRGPDRGERVGAMEPSEPAAARAEQGPRRHPKRRVLPSPAILRAAPSALVILLYTSILLLHHPISASTCCASGFVIDNLGTQCKLILVCAAFFSLAVSLGPLSGSLGGYAAQIECVCLMLLSIGGGMLLISSGDLMSLFLSLEIQSLCFYVLAATGRTSEFSTEAGLKYLVLGAFSSGVLLFGCSLLYGFSGTTSLYEVSLCAAPGLNTQTWGTGLLGGGTSVGLLFILFGVLFKLGAAPFHSWVPDVYDGAPIFITTFFAAVPKVAILAFVLRLFAAFGGFALGDQRPLLTSILATRPAFSRAPRQRVPTGPTP